MSPPLFSLSFCNIKTSPKLLLFSCRSVHGWFYHNFIINISLFQHLELKSRSPIRRFKPWLPIRFLSLSLPLHISNSLKVGYYPTRENKAVYTESKLYFVRIKFWSGCWYTLSKPVKTWNEMPVFESTFLRCEDWIGYHIKFLNLSYVPTYTHTLVNDIVTGWSTLGLLSLSLSLSL